MKGIVFKGCCAPIRNVSLGKVVTMIEGPPGALCTRCGYYDDGPTILFEWWSNTDSTGVMPLSWVKPLPGLGQEETEREKEEVL